MMLNVSQRARTRSNRKLAPTQIPALAATAMNTVTTVRADLGLDEGPVDQAERR